MDRYGTSISLGRRDALNLLGVSASPRPRGPEEVILKTDGGAISCLYHRAPAGNAAIVWVGGAGGGLDGPARGLYARLAERLLPKNIASLRLDYRFPNELQDCVLDTLMGVAYLATQNRARIALVGHSFGGAVVITAGAQTADVIAVAALSSQTFGTDQVDELSPRSLLLIHGTSDKTLPDWCARDIFERAREPKQILLYAHSGHRLEECRRALDKDLSHWLRETLA